MKGQEYNINMTVRTDGKYCHPECEFLSTEYDDDVECGRYTRLHRCCYANELVWDEDGKLERSFDCKKRFGV